MESGQTWIIATDERGALLTDTERQTQRRERKRDRERERDRALRGEAD